MRRENAAMYGTSLHQEIDPRRVTAEKREAEADLAAHARRLEEFDRSRHVVKFELSNGTKWSLTQLAAERRKLFEEQQRKGLLTLVPGIGGNAEKRLRNIEIVERAVQEKITERRTEMIIERDRVQDTVAALGELIPVFPASNSGGKEPQPARFNDYQLRRMEAHAAATKDIVLLKETDALMRQNATQDGALKKSDAERDAHFTHLAGRAQAREIVAGIEARSAVERERRNKEWSAYTPLIVTDKEGREYVTTRAQWEPRTAGSAVLHWLVATKGQREFKAAVGVAVRENEERIVGSKGIRSVLSGDARSSS